MSASPAPAAPRKRSFLRVWLPVLILLLGVTVVGLALGLPQAEWEMLPRPALALMTVTLVMLLMLLWWVFFSGVKASVRVPVLLLVAAAGAAGFFLVKEIKFTGDIVPHFVWLWTPSHDDVPMPEPSAALLFALGTGIVGISLRRRA